MKIAFITSYYAGEQLDAVTTSFFENTVEALAKAGHQTAVFALGDRDESVNRGSYRLECKTGDLERYANLHSLACAPVFSWTFTRAYETYRMHKSAVETFAPEVVLCVKAIDGIFWRSFQSLSVALMSVTPQFEIMRENFDGNLTPFDINLVTAVEIDALRGLSAIGAPSRMICDILVDVAQVERERVSTYRIAVEPVDSVSPWTGRKGFPHIAYVGTQERYKGIDVFIDAIPAIASQFPEALFTVAGESPPLFGESIPYKEKLSSKLGRFAKHVEWLPALNPEQRASLFNTCDAAVFPFRYCGCMYHVAEAMSFGCPVITTTVGSLKETLLDQQNAMLVEPENPVALAGAILRLANADALRNRIGEQAKAYIRENHSNAIALSDVVDLCTRAIEFDNSYRMSDEKTKSDSRVAPALKYWVAAIEDFCQKSYLPDLLNDAYARGMSAANLSRSPLRR